MKPKILIIGGNGFIGKNFCSFFSGSGFDVLIADHGLKNIKQNGEEVKKYAVDVHHTHELMTIADKVDFVIWLVHASVPSTVDDSLVDDFSLNIAPLIRFLEKSKSMPLFKKLIFLSSGGAIYGDVNSQKPIPENQEQSPISSYGLSKSVLEKYIEYITRDSAFESIILRPSNIYGPYQNFIKPQGIIGYAFRSIKNKTALDLYDEGKVVRDFLFVNDLAKAVNSCLVGDAQPGKVSFYNVGSGVGYSIKEIVTKIEEITGEKIELNLKQSRKFDCAYNVLDNNKLASEKNWRADTSLDEGLIEVWQWIKSEK